MQITSRLLCFLIQQPLVLFNNVMPQIWHPHLPAHHPLKVGIKLFGLPQIHHVVYGLRGKVVLDSPLLVVLSLYFCFFMTGLKFRMTLEEA